MRCWSGCGPAPTCPRRASRRRSRSRRIAVSRIVPGRRAPGSICTSPSRSGPLNSLRRSRNSSGRHGPRFRRPSTSRNPLEHPARSVLECWLSQSPTHKDLRDSTALYALGSLTPHERSGMKRHLDGCAACAGEVRSFAPVIETLALSVVHLAPPAALRARLRHAIIAQPGQVAGATRRHVSGRVLL